jgi:hypothetical protein
MFLEREKDSQRMAEFSSSLLSPFPFHSKLNIFGYPVDSTVPAKQARQKNHVGNAALVLSPIDFSYQQFSSIGSGTFQPFQPRLLHLLPLCQAYSHQ